MERVDREIPLPRLVIDERADPADLPAPLRLAHSAARETVDEFMRAADGVQHDERLSDLAKSEKVAELGRAAQARLAAHYGALDIIEQNLAGREATAVKKAVDASDPQRAGLIIGHVAAMSREDRGRLIAEAVQAGDVETCTALLNAPGVLKLVPEQWVPRLRRVIFAKSDPTGPARVDLVGGALGRTQGAYEAADSAIAKRARIAATSAPWRQRMAAK